MPHGVHMEIPRKALEPVKECAGYSLYGGGAIIADVYWDIIRENYLNHDYYKIKRLKRMLALKHEEMEKRYKDGVFLNLGEKEKRILKRLNENAGGKVG